MLRFMPRRAAMHKYPVVGRFSKLARRRAYLWSIKPKAIRPALYAGSILSLMPVMGVQLPLALLLSVLLRANFMVLGGLQFITNPFTAAPIYLATYELGAAVIRVAGFGEAPRAADPRHALLPLTRQVASASELGATSAPPGKVTTASRIRRLATAFNALIVGGAFSGAALGLLLDLLYRLYWQHHTHPTPHRQKHPHHSSDGSGHPSA